MYNFPGILIVLLFITVGIGFKLSLAPSHQWTPDVDEEEQAPTEETEEEDDRGRRRRRGGVGGEGIVLYGQKIRSFYNIRVKDNFTISPRVLGAPAKMLGTPSNTQIQGSNFSPTKPYTQIGLIGNKILYKDSVPKK